MWNDWFIAASLPLVWVMLGTLGMYVTVLVFARLAGVRSFAEMSTFDIAVTIAIGSLLASTVVSKDPPLLQGIVATGTLYMLQLGVSRTRKRFRVVETAVDNAPILLVGPGGDLLQENMRVARVTEDDLRMHLRIANVTDLTQVKAVVIEGTGTINVLHGDNGRLDRDEWILQGVRDYSTAATSIEARRT